MKGIIARGRGQTDLIEIQPECEGQVGDAAQAQMKEVGVVQEKTLEFGLREQTPTYEGSSYLKTLKKNK